MNGNHGAQRDDDMTAPRRMDRGVSGSRYRKLRHHSRGQAVATSAFIFHPCNGF